MLLILAGSYALAQQVHQHLRKKQIFRCLVGDTSSKIVLIQKRGALFEKNEQL